jgi:hypothetical protein
VTEVEELKAFLRLMPIFGCVIIWQMCYVSHPAGQQPLPDLSLDGSLNAGVCDRAVGFCGTLRIRSKSNMQPV